MRPNLLGIGVHGLALALEIIFERIPNLAVGDVVTRPGARRLEPATHLVLPLGPGLEAAHTALDAELDPLVVARLEVQAVKIGGCAPVTTEQRLPAPEEDRGRNRFAGTHGELDHERLTERTCRFAEERPRQIWLPARAPKRGARRSGTLV